MKKFLFLFFIFIFACREAKIQATKNEEQKKLSQNNEENFSLPELSIFHLPSKWKNQNNEDIKLGSLRGSPLVLVMIYTSCIATCPILVSNMKDIKKKVSVRHKDVKYLLVSIDPKVDTPKRLKEFAIKNGIDDTMWYLLQGTEESVLEFANVLSVKYKKISPMDFSHSNIISVFDKNGVLKYQQQDLRVNNDETIKNIMKIASK